MEASTIAIIVSLTSFVVAGIAPIVSGIQAGRDRDAQRRKEWINFLSDSLKVLVALRGEYEEILAKTPENFTGKDSQYRYTYAGIVGRFISIVLSVDNDELRRIAIDRLTPNQVDQRSDPEGTKAYGAHNTRNRDAMSEAVEIIGKLIRKELTQ